MNFWNPTYFYLTWLGIYWVFNFIIAWKVIEEKKYNTLYVWFNSQKYWQNYYKGGKVYALIGDWTPKIYFAIGHFIYYLIDHVLAMAAFEYYYVDSFFCCYFMFVACWNGANYYMDYFASRYEAKLAALEALSGKDLTMEERQAAAWDTSS
jgi:hypothetical protein